MGKQIMKVSGEFLVDCCKASSGWYHLEVVSDALPEDARLVRVIDGPDPTTISLLVESAEWPNIKPYGRAKNATIRIISDDEVKPDAE